jgi:hypothetical protein
LGSYKQDLKIRIIEDLGPYGTVVPMQRRNNTAKVIMANILTELSDYSREILKWFLLNLLMLLSL